MENFKLYYISEEYIEYLRTFDKRVAYNKKRTRPYIGIVYKYKDNYYFAPLHSPKKKHIQINANSLDIIKIRQGILGVVNINNMIPVLTNQLTEVLSSIQDKKYKTLLEDQLTYLNNNKKYVRNKILRFQKLYRGNLLPQRILDRTCDFVLLEEKMKEYKND